MKTMITGILAHVDAGKTTLSEGLLYTAGTIRKMGKVDTKDAFLDTNQLERARGITIFSKQARLEWKDRSITILDTPGHVDFSAEMERVLSVLDYAILVISGADGVQGHTLTLWQLLKTYDVPVFLFVNKMDQPGVDAENVLQELKDRLDSECVDFSNIGSYEFCEEVASCDESAMEEFFETEQVETKTIIDLIAGRKCFPVFFGSALKYQGIDQFLDGFVHYTKGKEYPVDFGARVFKVSRDESGNRLTHLKITGGNLKTKQLLSGVNRDGEEWQEKINQIRLYNGEKYETVSEIAAGEVCAVTGLSLTYPGQVFGCEEAGTEPILEPVLSRQIILPADVDAGVMLPKLRLLEEEQPELHIVWEERLQEIQAQVMGEVQIEILHSLILERFSVDVSFGPTHIVYRETIASPVEGVGHFEPLRHYAEVHLLMEPLPAGSGMQYATDCSEDVLDKNWQRLILTHLKEKIHRGVLTRSAITDMKITVVAGRAHQKHTEGGDFRQATYRAVRQGLMEAESILLEPFYNFRMEIPEQMIGRAMTDIENMNGHFDTPYQDGDMTVLTGYAPVVTMQDYKQEIAAYSKGFGRVTFSLRGYEACHNQEEVVAARAYDPEADKWNSPDSVFCANGSGFIVPWYEVKSRMHVESPFSQKSVEDDAIAGTIPSQSDEEIWLGTEEIDAILDRTYNANKRNKSEPRKGPVKKYGKADYIAPVTRNFNPSKPKDPKEQYLLVDGYNIIFAWDDLNEMAKDNLDAARGQLLDQLCNYQGMKKMNLIAVFDAYRLAGHPTEYYDYHNIHVVFTKEAETADQYIEKFAHEHAKNYEVTVATSDGLEQIIIRGEGCRLLSARDLKAEMELAGQNLKEQYLTNQQPDRNRPFEAFLSGRDTNK